ncbi:MAG: cell wall metabolism sensor histidine kinase WalK, partial [Cyanobacteria bacterium]|nr:cell wall metabolism sensor histidine kinase WalK [Cyanobacteriota bacterium]
MRVGPSSEEISSQKESESDQDFNLQLGKAGKSAMHKPNFFSSENQILLLIIFSISLAFLFVAFGVSYNSKSSLDENYAQFGDLVANVVAVGASDRLGASMSPELKVKNFMDEMLAVSPDIYAIEIFDTKGKLVLESKQKKSNLSDPNALPEDISIPLVQKTPEGESFTTGTIHVKLTGKTRNDVSKGTNTIVIIVFISAWFISILAVSLNTYFLSKHLKTLVRGVKRLSTGDFGYKISEHDLWGELKHLAESFNDMSMRLRAYEDQNLDTITFERNKLEAVLLSIADGVIVCDITGETIIVNDSACRMLGVKSSNVLISNSIRDYVTVEGIKCFEPILKEFDQICREYHNRLPETFSRQIEMPNQILKVIISPIQDSEGENLGYVMIMHDVTKEMEVDKLKTNFISNVSHELRTPVTTIKSYVDTIYNHGDELDKETYAEFIETINVETDRLKKLVNDILDFSRLEEGGYRLEMEELDITPVINLTVQSVKVLAQQKNLTLTTAIESNLPKIYMNSDSIERVLRNLLSNAIKYTPDGGRIKVRSELSEGGESLEVSVQDSGIGIPEEHIPYIFDRFYRVENKVHTVK